MAFMGRGEAPNIGNNDKDNVPDNAIRRYRYIWDHAIMFH